MGKIFPGPVSFFIAASCPGTPFLTWFNQYIRACMRHYIPCFRWYEIIHPQFNSNSGMQTTVGVGCGGVITARGFVYTKLLTHALISILFSCSPVVKEVTGVPLNALHKCLFLIITMESKLLVYLCYHPWSGNCHVIIQLSTNYRLSAGCHGISGIIYGEWWCLIRPDKIITGCSQEWQRMVHFYHHIVIST